MARHKLQRHSPRSWSSGHYEPPVRSAGELCEFDQVVTRLRLREDQYHRSAELRAWVERNKNSKYVPELLLEKWGMFVDDYLTELYQPV